MIKERCIESGRFLARCFADQINRRRYEASCCNRYKDAADKPPCVRKVSVIIPCYNHSVYLEERIESILRQDYPIHELIFLDDASTDDSMKLARELLREAPFPVAFIENETNSGCTFVQWKKGAEVATGDYLWIAESDDYCEKSFLSTAMKGFADERVVLSYTESVVVDENGSAILPVSRKMHDIFSDGHWDKPYINSGAREIASYLCVNNSILNASAVVWKNARDLPEIFSCASEFRLAGDWFAYTQVLSRGDIAYASEPMNCFRMHKGTVRDSTVAEKEQFEIETLYKLLVEKCRPNADVLLRQRRRLELMGDMPAGKGRKKIAWVTTMPFPGSGGHRNVLDHVNALARFGFDCDVYIIDATRNARSVRRSIEGMYGPIAAQIYVKADMKIDYDLVFATTWDSAFVVNESDCTKKAYFVQDYEPWFYQEGSEQWLRAQETYRFGFSAVTIGRWLAKKIEDEAGTPSRFYDFCIDQNAYYPLNDSTRERAVCAIFQPEKPRRNADLVCKVFQRLHEEDPSIVLYAYGSAQTDERLARSGVHELGILNVEELRALYNRCSVGFCFSLSNPSKIPFEMAGCGLPVIELDCENNRHDFPEGVATLVPMEEDAITEAILQIINDSEKVERSSAKAAESMLSRSLEFGHEQFISAVVSILAE